MYEQSIIWFNRIRFLCISCVCVVFCRRLWRSVFFCPLFRDDYYPFGGRHANPSYAQTTANRQKFNGKELQTTGNTGFLDYAVILIDPDGRDWVDHKGKIAWINNVKSANDKDLQKGDKYLERNVLVGIHNRDANLKESINSARFDLYLERNHEGPTSTIYLG